MGCSQFIDEHRRYTISKVCKINPAIESEFEIIEEIGRGGFSTVLSAFDRTGRRVALKCINLPSIRSDLHLLDREVSILRELNHPNIVKLLGVYKEDETVYLSMELCEGGSLKSRLDQGVLSESSAKRVAKQMLSALNYLHKHQIGHRDLKADNVLFTRDGLLKIADFGLARTMSKIRPYSRVGTPYYIAPEVIHGAFNWQCDLWSAGVLVYYSITGVMPFEGETMTSLLNKIESATNVDYSQIPSAAQDFLKHLIEPDSKIRYNAEQALQHPWLLS